METSIQTKKEVINNLQVIFLGIKDWIWYNPEFSEHLPLEEEGFMNFLVGHIFKELNLPSVYVVLPQELSQHYISKLLQRNITKLLQLSFDDDFPPDTYPSHTPLITISNFSRTTILSKQPYTFLSNSTKYSKPNSSSLINISGSFNNINTVIFGTTGVGKLFIFEKLMLNLINYFSFCDLIENILTSIIKEVKESNEKSNIHFDFTFKCVRNITNPYEIKNTKHNHKRRNSIRISQAKLKAGFVEIRAYKKSWSLVDHSIISKLKENDVNTLVNNSKSLFISFISSDFSRHYSLGESFLGKEGVCNTDRYQGYGIINKYCTFLSYKHLGIRPIELMALMPLKKKNTTVTSTSIVVTKNESNTETGNDSLFYFILLMYMRVIHYNLIKVKSPLKY